MSKIRKLTMGDLGAFGQARNSPLMTLLGQMKDEDLDEQGALTMSIILNLAKQVESLIANVQNLTRTVQDFGVHGDPPAKGNRTEVTKEKRPEPAKKSYTWAATGASTTDPQTPTKRSRKRKGSEGPTPPRQPQQKTARGDSSGGEEKNGEHTGWKTVGELKSRNARAARRKIFATRLIAKPLADPAREEAKIATMIATLLTNCKCEAPVNLQVTSNKINGTVTITTPAGTDSGRYQLYLNKMTIALNSLLGQDEPQFLPFWRVPTDVSLMVHGILYDSVPDNNADLDIAIKEQFNSLYKVVFVTGQGGAGFHSPGPTLRPARGGYFSDYPRPAPVRGPPALIP